MVAKSTQTTFRQLSFYKDFTLSGDLARAVTSTGPMTFTANGLPLVPLYINNTDRYHAYFRRVEPTIVFGRIDSGVPNREQADSVTFLDAVWKNAPFANQGQFVSTVTRTAEEWVTAGLMTWAQKDTVVLRPPGPGSPASGGGHQSWTRPACAMISRAIFAGTAAGAMWPTPSRISRRAPGMPAA